MAKVDQVPVGTRKASFPVFESYLCLIVTDLLGLTRPGELTTHVVEIDQIEEDVTQELQILWSACL